MFLDIDIGLILKGEYLSPIITRTPEQSVKIAVCLHPWSWLGGNMHDPVLDVVVQSLRNTGYHVFRYNSRGTGGSSGWPSLSGFTEGRDLEAVVEWSLQYLQSLLTSSAMEISDVTIVGYSHGSLIASLYPRNTKMKTSHILISYPLGPRSYLTLFCSSTYVSKLRELILSQDSNILIIYGDQDEFTSVKRYGSWAKELAELEKESPREPSRTSGQDNLLEQSQRGLTVCCRSGASHFWRGRHGVWLAEAVTKWLH
ncbi:Alpha/Beta hydrolase protein [Lentinula aciculospora]|uniref:Alpha/Beta hydrolase protein n=1 Tax=Lentinula aciculospora TaxID=153920 RepID=A0A9W9A4F0_9AGAR|nr:Alpha/Beta hydrolase protein [Lentinula aciculospora]